MVSKVEQVQAFKSYDGTVHPTRQQAQFHNIDYFVDELFGDDDSYDGVSSADIRKRVKFRLKNGSRPNGARDAIQHLAEELE